MNNKKKKKRKINTGKMITVLSFIFMVIIGAYAFLNSSVFDIKNIEIEGNNRVNSDTIKNELQIKENKNIFMYTTKKMEDRIKEDKYIDSVEIKKNLPNGLTVKVKEKEIIGILKSEGNYCYIDNQGNIVDKVQTIDDNETSVIVNIDYTVVEDNKLNFKNEEIKKGLLYLLECIKENNLNKKINKIDYEKNDIINMYTEDGIKITLKNNEEIKYNIDRSSEILVDLQSKNAKGGMVDLTSGNYAVYRP